jgi:peptidoglycan lytic transglycosylase
MKYLLQCLSLPSRRHRFIIYPVFILILVCQTVYQPAGARASAQGRASTQLRTAVASNSEAELQRVENANSGTEEAGLARLLRGYLRYKAKDYQAAANVLNSADIAELTKLGDYAVYYRSQALAEGGRKTEAEREYRKLANTYPSSLLARSAALQAAGSAIMSGNYQAAIDDLAPLVNKNDGTALKLRADALEKLNRTNEAILTLRKLYFDAPQSAEAEKVGERLAALGSSTSSADASQLRKRADKLYQAGLYALAAQAYDQIGRQFPEAANSELSLLAGTCFYKANSFRQAVDALARARSSASKSQVDAIYYFALANLSMNTEAPALQALADLRRIAPDSPRYSDLIYTFGRYHEKRNRETETANYYSQLIRQFPTSEHSDEAHYFLAWRTHRSGDFKTASKLLLEHIADYSDVTENRGKAAYWAALDSERAGDRAQALALYRGLLKRYGAGWYGLNAERRINKLSSEGVQSKSIQSDPVLRRAIEGLQSVKLPQEELADTEIERVTKAEQLMRIALHQSAMNELEAAREKAPDSPRVNLRIAQIYRANGENAAALNTLRRAYPDYGQTLPEEMSREVWEIFYPLKFWTNIKEEARRHGLDPFMIAGLIRQETVFEPQVRSYANAYGLMQVLPSTGRAIARRNSLGGGRITTSDLYNPTLNIQLGCAYVKELIDRFGRFEYVAAAYNGGPTRVSRWLKELPTGDIEEWVESIPISQTRLYVQGVYRNARQYQRLYDEQGRFKSNVPER